MQFQFALMPCFYLLQKLYKKVVICEITSLSLYNSILDTHMTKTDRVDLMTQKLRREFPELDFAAKEVTGRVVRLAYVFQARFEKVLKIYDLSLQVFSILAAIRVSGSPYAISPTQILATSFLTTGGLSNILKRLEGKNLVTRIPDPSDRRGVLVQLTTKGKQVIEEALFEQIEEEKRITKILSQEEQDTLQKLLAKVLIDIDPSVDNT